MNRPTSLARLAGLLYLALTVLGGWAQLYVRGTVYVRGDASATAANIAEHETLFRLGLVADILMATVFVLLGLTLHRLLYHVDERASTALLVFVAVGAGAILVNLTFHVGALLVATDPAYAAAGTGDGTLPLLLLTLHQEGYVLGGIFFGLWLLPMAYLVFRSGMFPRALGVLLLIGCGAWVAHPLIAFTLPDVPDLVRDIATAPTAIAEFSLLLYLLVVGVRRPDAASPAARWSAAAAKRS